MPPREIIQYLLPFLVTAGDYTACVQKRVGRQNEKGGATAFHHALSDADLTVQAFLEVVLLARFPTVSFFSEEQDQSLNVKYFPTDSELEILLDPVDGTRAYIDKSEHYQIIVGVHDRIGLVGAMCYLPRRDRCYIGLRGEGAFLLSRKEMMEGKEWNPLTIKSRGGPVLVFNAPELAQKIEPHFEVLDILTSYENAPDKHKYIDIFEGSSIANVYLPCQGIDGGAMAFIASEAGAILTDFSGRPLGSYRENEKRILPNAVVSLDAHTHEKLLKVLA